MLIDMVKMPPTFGVPIDRRFTVNALNKNCSERDISAGSWPILPLTHHNFTVGTTINVQPKELYKSFHVSSDDRFVFETVFSKEDQGYICLYTKIISSFGVNIGLSVNAIQFYQGRNEQLVPSSWLIITPSNRQNTVPGIVPVVFGGSGLWSFAHRLFDTQFGSSGETLEGWDYKPLLQHQPSLFEALIEGKFYRSPFHELNSHHPLIRINKDKWFDYQKLHLMTEACGFTTELNHPDFDPIALAALDINTAKFSVSCLMSHALDGLEELWLTREYDDPYHALLLGMMSNRVRYNRKLINLLYLSAKLYCKLYRLDPDVFLRHSTNLPTDISSVTVTKNIYDEVSVTFHDLIHDRYVCFYSSFPIIALATLSVGATGP